MLTKITSDMKGKINVIQYDYGNTKDFSSNPIIKKVDVLVDTKIAKDLNGNEITYPIFDLDNT